MPVSRLLLAAMLLFSLSAELDAVPRQQHSAFTVNLFKLASGPCLAKGRIQDAVYDKSKDRLEEIHHIMRHGTDSVQALADSLINSRPVPAMVCGWKGMALGDVALITLLDLFREPGGRSTAPELNWDTFLDRSSPRQSTEEVLREFVRKHGRHGLREKWNAFWKEHKEEVIWDDRDRCYRTSPGHPQ